MTPTVLIQSTDAVDRTAYSTGSVTFTAGKVGFIGAVNTRGSAPTTPTISGWTNEGTIGYDSAGVPTKRVTLFSNLFPTSGNPSIDFGGVTQTACSWVVFEVDAYTAGNATPQAKTGTGAAVNTFAITFSSAFAHPNNRPFGLFGMDDNSGITPESGWTSLADQNNLPAHELKLIWRDDQTDTSPGVASTDTANKRWGGVIFEVKAATGGVGVLYTQIEHITRGLERGVYSGGL